MKNELAVDLTLAKRKSQYDTYCKWILANKISLAWILKYATEEFREMEISQIKKCIGVDVQIAKAKVLPGQTNLQTDIESDSQTDIQADTQTGMQSAIQTGMAVRMVPDMTEAEKVTVESQEDSVPGEGELYYDIRFSVYYARMKCRIKLIINVEAQKDFRPCYSLTTRGIFYGARMISAQKGTEFSGMDYDNIRKVYSIWICMNAPDSVGNTISDYSIYKRDKIPGIPDRKEE